MRITSINTGSTKSRYGLSAFGILKPSPVLTSSWNLSKPHPSFVTQNSTKISEPIGSIRLLTIKSSKSRTFPFPRKLMPLHLLNPSTHGRLAKIIKMQLRTIDLLLSIPKLSVTHATRFSKTAVTVEKLAKDINTKNSVPHTIPNGMLMKILGSVTNISEGPWLGATPKEKHAGKIMMPEAMATIVSRTAIHLASPIRVFSFDI